MPRAEGLLGSTRVERARKLAVLLASYWTVFWVTVFALLALAFWAGIASHDAIVTTWESWFVTTIIALMFGGVLSVIAGIAHAFERLHNKSHRATRGSSRLRS